MNHELRPCVACNALVCSHPDCETHNPHRGHSMRVIEGGNQPKRWACCDSFRRLEEDGVFVATENGYSAVEEEFNNVLFDMYFCPICGASLPRIKE